MDLIFPYTTGIAYLGHVGAAKQQSAAHPNGMRAGATAQSAPHGAH